MYNLPGKKRLQNVEFGVIITLTSSPPFKVLYSSSVVRSFRHIQPFDDMSPLLQLVHTNLLCRVAGTWYLDTIHLAAAGTGPLAIVPCTCICYYRPPIHSTMLLYTYWPTVQCTRQPVLASRLCHLTQVHNPVQPPCPSSGRCITSIPCLQSILLTVYVNPIPYIQVFWNVFDTNYCYALSLSVVP